jgi:D-alanyl-lipoteichoic acid acyltransferase DltB (MBOAT superfamily)
MNFHDPAFGLFLPVVFVVWWWLRGRQAERLVWIVLASWFFYGCWNAKYVLLIVGSTLLDFWLGRLIAATPGGDAGGERRRKRLVALSVAANLGVLGVFKYYNFFRDSVAEAFSGLGLEAPLPWIDVLLPPGISFYTFQSISYIVDVYRGLIPAERSLLRYATFIAFFPQLVAGPILRASQFLPQLSRPPGLTRDDFAAGVYRILVGLGKKVLIADVLAVELVQRGYADGSTVHGAEALLVVYGFAFQVYADFSGYSDLAIGTARLFGFHVPENFQGPYLARSISEFWRRWHISLSFWLRDYLYIPLGGNRRSEGRTYVNLIATMVLSGLWHGAGWHFVIWGFLHGVMLSVNRWWQRTDKPWLPGRLGHVAAVLLTSHLVALALVLFRAPDFESAMDFFHRLFSTWETPQITRGALVALLLGIGTHGLSGFRNGAVQRAFTRLPMPVAGALTALFLGVLAHFRVPALPFVYFQF